MSELRVGIGVDLHRFSSDASRRLVLGGVALEGTGLEGHSDGDACCHAVCDALLGAAGLGDLGTHFPDSDASLAGVDSLELLAAVRAKLEGAGFHLVNCDCTLVAERPRVEAVREEMGARLAEAAGGPVHVKAASPEGLGSLGRAEGVECLAVCLIER